MKLWVARNQDGSLWLHEEKPSLGYSDESRKWYYESNRGSFELYDETLLPEVTYESSPQEVELKLMNEIVSIAESPLKTFPRINEFEVGASYRC